MLIAASQILGTTLHGRDDNLGNVKDLYFDDAGWTVRYLVVDTGLWLSGRKVLLSPEDVQVADWTTQTGTVPHSRQEIKESPPIGEHQPVSRQKELELTSYFRWPTYWQEQVTSPQMQALGRTKAGETTAEEPALRSAREVLSYHIEAKDGEVGHVEDMIVDDQSWMIRYIAIDTRNWLPGRKVLISPMWAEAVRWSDKAVHVDLTRDTIKDSPQFDPSAPINRQYEQRLYDYYGRQRYWLD